MSRRERDLAVLRLVGLAPGKTKLACILETCVFAVVGVLVGSVLYAVTLPAWGALSFQGRPMGASEMWVGVVALLVEGLAMILLAALSSWLAMRKVAITPLGVARRPLGSLSRRPVRPCRPGVQPADWTAPPGPAKPVGYVDVLSGRSACELVTGGRAPDV